MATMALLPGFDMGAENRTLTDADVEAVVCRLLDSLGDVVAKHLAEHAIASQGGEPAGMDWMTAAQVAKRLQVDRDWVYEHQDELGVERIGKGPKPRLRFHPDRVEAMEWRVADEASPAIQKRQRGRPATTKSGAPLLPIRNDLE